MNRIVEVIWCIQHRVKLSRTQISIGAHVIRDSPWKENPGAAGHPQKQEIIPASSDGAPRVRFVRPLILPAYTKVKAVVVTKL